MIPRLALAVLLLASACQLPPPAVAPDQLEDVAAALPDGPRRASVHLVIDAAHALEAGRADAARALAERALRMDGRNPHAYYLLARAALARGDRASARRDLEQAEVLLASADPPSPSWQGKLLRLRAELLEHAGDHGGAAALRLRAARLDPAGHMPGTPPGHRLDQRP